MASNFGKVWLGFEDEYITDKHKGVVNYTTNKIGGKPDWPSNATVENLKCTLCQLPKPLVLQIYAPKDNSPYHRTLYLFACVNPNCWNHTESWSCIRIQSLEKSDLNDDTTIKTHTNVKEWCQDADDWDDDNNANMNEENGNTLNNIERISDEDDESCSIEESLRMNLDCLTVDDRNANLEIGGDIQGGAVGRLHSPRPSAEIEGNEGEVISIDSPTLPQHNLSVLLQEVTPLPHDLCYRTEANIAQFSSLEFLSSFIFVCEESGNLNATDHHVKELLVEYQQKNEKFVCEEVDLAGCSGIGEEGYEKTAPAHGDKIFHYFLTRIQKNPGQLLRYSRDGGSPLLLYPLKDVSRKCDYCDGEMIFEFQVLPTIIPKLKLINDKNEGTRVEFGTVLVFTCNRSCWVSDATLRKEYVILQTEKN